MKTMSLTDIEHSPQVNVKTLTGEELIISKLISIENRITTIETSMTWFKFIARSGIITVAGFLGFNFVGVI